MHNINKKRRIIGTKERPRLSVFRSNKYLYAQIFDDETGITIAGITEKNITSGKTRIDRAHELGILIAKKALEKKLNKVVFDRGRQAYHGLVKAIADGAREGGLQF